MERKTALFLAASFVLLCVVLATAGALVGYVATVRVAAPSSPTNMPAAVRAGVALPVDNSGRALGIRISSDHGAIDWQKLSDAGLAFAVARAVVGSRFVDAAFEAHRAGMRESGVVPGAYAVFVSEDEAAAQADRFIDTVDRLGDGELPPLLLVTERRQVDPRALGQGLRTWLMRVQAALGRRPMLGFSSRPAEPLLAELAVEFPLWVDRAPVGPQTLEGCAFVGSGKPVELYGRALRAELYSGTIEELHAFVAASITGTPTLPPSASAGSSIGQGPPARARATLPPRPGGLDDAARGIFVSGEQGRVEWQQLQEAGLAFGYARATAGSAFVDERFANHWWGMREAGVLRGAYHVFDEKAGPVAQADHFVQTVGSLLPRDLPPAVFIPEPIDAETLPDRLRAWLEHVEQALSRRLVVCAAPELFSAAFAAQFPEYRPCVRKPAIKAPPTTVPPWSFWEYRMQTPVAGAEGYAHAVVFAGDPDELAAFTASMTVQPSVPDTAKAPCPVPLPNAAATPVPDTPPMTYRVRCGDTLFRIAKQHGVSVEALARVNGITDPTKLPFGIVLTIPR